MDPFRPKKTEDELLDEVRVKDTIKESLNKSREEVKFTWDGFSKAITSAPVSPFNPLFYKRLEELKKGSPAKEKDYIDAFEEAEKTLYGGEVMEEMTETVDMVTGQGQTQDLTYRELRSRLPREITNDVVSLIATSKQALTDFANIQTQQDVDNFNSTYNVNLVLPQEG